MSEQQFAIESERISTTYSVRILKDDEVIFEISNWDSLGEMHKKECEDIVALLNGLYEERNTLHQENQILETYCKVQNESKEYWRNKTKRLEKENEQLRQTMQKVYKLLEEEVDLFSEKAIEHDIIAYREMQDFDNKDAYCICTATKKAIQMLKR